MILSFSKEQLVCGLGMAANSAFSINPKFILASALSEIKFKLCLKDA